MDDPVRPGEILAQKYRVDRVLGVGGMGVVVAATHLELEQREARVAVKLRSEHVARVSDTGTLENGTPYIVMEYLEGTDLTAQIAIGVGAAFDAAAISKNHSSSGDCGLNGNANDCNQAGVDLRQTAYTDGTVSTVFIGVGGAAVVGGVVLRLTGRPSGATTVGFDGRSVQLAGRF